MKISSPSFFAAHQAKQNNTPDKGISSQIVAQERETIENNQLGKELDGTAIRRSHGIDAENIILDLNHRQEARFKTYHAKDINAKYSEMQLNDLPTFPERSLEDAIIHNFYPVGEVNDRLHHVLEGKEPALSQATREIIESIHANEEDTTPLEREQLRDLAKSQAEYIAKQFLSEEEASEYLAAIDEIISYADFSKHGMELVGYTSMDKGGRSIYKPIGAPDGYVAAGEVLAKYMNENEYGRFQDTLVSSKGEALFSKDVMKYLKKFAAHQGQAYTEFAGNMQNVQMQQEGGMFSKVDASNSQLYLKTLESTLENQQIYDSVKYKIQSFLDIIQG